MKYIILLFTLMIACSQTSIAASNDTSKQQNSSPVSLDQLLSKVQQHKSNEEKLYREREQRFLNARNQQKRLLEDAQKEFLKAQEKNNPLQTISDENAARIKWMKEDLQKNIAELGDIYTSYHQFSGDIVSRMQNSLVHSQFPDRQEKLIALSEASKLPAIEDIRTLWLLMHEEMTESGKQSSYDAPVIQTDGSIKNQTVTRVATFTLKSGDDLLRYIPETQEILVVNHKFSWAGMDNRNIIIDPTRGSLLGILGQSPSLQERITQGKEVGYIIISLGIIGLLMGTYRIIYLLRIRKKIHMQLNDISHASNNNPLGRVLLQVQGVEIDDDELLQSKLDEAILKEIPALEQGQGLIKLLAAISPLLGLLGTVIGMIATFQSISLFGSGDPKLMASGISQALITTVLGLVAAIPLLFLHNFISSISRSLVQILDEQSAGMLAKYYEKQRGLNQVQNNQ